MGVLRKMVSAFSWQWLSRYIVCALMMPFDVVCLAAANGYTIKDVPNVRLQDSRDYVSDPASLLAPSTHDSINAIFSSLEHATGIETAVVMLPSIGDADPFDFSVELFRSWRIGKKKNDNGLLILYVEDQHNIRFTTGYGIEGILTDAVSKRIQMRYMVPAFKEGNRDLGMVDGCRAVAGVLDGSMVADEEDDDAAAGFAVLAIIVFGFIIVVVLASVIKGKCPQCGKRTLVLKSEKIHKVKGKRYRWAVYQCSHCGHIVEEDKPTNDDDGTGALLTGMAAGSILNGGSRSSGGSTFHGGSFGGGFTGGGGAGSSW